MARQRRSFSPEYQSEVGKLVSEGSRSVGQVCRELDLTETAVHRWVAQAAVDAGRGAGGAEHGCALSCGACAVRTGNCAWSAKY